MTDSFPSLPVAADVVRTPTSERSDVGFQATAATGHLFADDAALADDLHDESASPSHAAVTAQLEAWALQLGDWLKRTKLFRQLLDIFDASEKDTKPLLWRDLVEKLTTVELGLLAFTDSVQDASHRAGFFSARTYQFTFRTALPHVIDFAGPTGSPLPDAGRLVLEWWSHSRPAWTGGIKNAMASLMPPDLRDYTDFVEYRDNPSRQHPSAG